MEERTGGSQKETEMYESNGSVGEGYLHNFQRFDAQV